MEVRNRYMLQLACALIIAISMYGLIHCVTGWPVYGPVDLIKLITGGM